MAKKKSTEVIEVVPLSSESVLLELFKDDTVEISHVIPEDISPERVIAAVRACVAGLDLADKARVKLVAKLGLLMAHAAKDSRIYQEAGYTSLADFEKAEILDRVSHGSLWSYKKIVEVFPHQSLEDLAQITHKNLSDAARVVEGKSESQKETILEKARELPNKEFREWLEDASHAGKGQLSYATYVLTGSQEEINDLNALLDNPGCARHFETSSTLQQIIAALQESSPEWPVGDDEMPPHAPAPGEVSSDEGQNDTTQEDGPEGF